VVAGALLAVCYAGFYFVFQRVVREQFDRRLGEIAAPIIFDIAGDPQDNDVDLLNLPSQYFEVLDASGAVLQRSQNLKSNLPISIGQTGFQTVRLPETGELRLTLIPFEAGSTKPPQGLSTRS
jgi:hypothetical protein